MDRLPPGYLRSLLTLRSYARRYREYQAAEARKDDAAMNDPRLADIVDTAFAIAREDLARGVTVR